METTLTEVAGNMSKSRAFLYLFAFIFLFVALFSMAATAVEKIPSDETAKQDYIARNVRSSNMKQWGITILLIIIVLDLGVLIFRKQN